MRRKSLIVTIGILLLLAFCKANSQANKWIKNMAKRQLDQAAPRNTGPIPDYSNDFFWAALPTKHNPSDSVPSFLKNEIQSKEVDVFFIYPTSYKSVDGVQYDLGDVDSKKMFNAMKKAPWNADLTDTSVNNSTDGKSLLYQASVFNASCRIYSPRYRQANLKAFMVGNSANAEKAFNLAYSDVKAAFEYYLKNYNQGRPIIIASHSQGSLHAIRLLQEFFDGKLLQNRLVCAYIIGHRIPKDAFKHIPIGINALSTGCFVGWRSFQKSKLPESIQEENGDAQCVNPLTWTIDYGLSPSCLNHGVLLDFNQKYTPTIQTQIDSVSKVLWVDFEDQMPPKIKKLKNLHIIDYNLFWMNIRENVKARVAAFYKK